MGVRILNIYISGNRNWADSEGGVGFMAACRSFDGHAGASRVSPREIDNGSELSTLRICSVCCLGEQSLRSSADKIGGTALFKIT